MPAIINAPGFPLPLVHETYTCATPQGLEYGFTFKEEGSEDTVFDLVLGLILHENMETAHAVLKAEWARHEWAALAITTAAATTINR